MVFRIGRHALRAVTCEARRRLRAERLHVGRARLPRGEEAEERGGGLRRRAPDRETARHFL